MNERRYRHCPDPHDLISFLDQRLSERAFRLFACACCRRIESLLEDPRSSRIVTLTEQLLDGQVKPGVWQQAAEAARAAEIEADGAAEDPGLVERVERHRAFGRAEAAGAAAAVARASPTEAARMAARYAGWAVARRGTLGSCAQQGWTQEWDRLEEEEQRFQAALLRDVAGYPLRAVQFEPVWRVQDDALVVRLAEGIYQEGAWERLPILADALEELGCTDESILSHARGAGPHVCGCWVVDLVRCVP